METGAREVRIHESMLAAAEKRLLIRIAARLPRRVTSDQLTGLGALAMLGAGMGYALGPGRPGALLLAIALIGVNWFGDSLDGTLARVRRQERPRYGFYVDHVLDALGMLFLVGGLAAGGFMSVLPAAAFLLAYYLLTIEIALATHTLGVFRISYWKFGPTELRILLAAGTLRLLDSPWITLGGTRLLLFDVGAAVAAALLLTTFLVSAVDHARRLYRLEPISRERASAGTRGGAERAIGAQAG